MTVATFVQPNYLTQSASAYKAAIDAAIAVLNSIGGDFAPHASTAPNMQVVIDAGRIFKPGGTIVSVAQQTTGALIAPVSNPRIDRIVVDSEDGIYSVLMGTESASPVAPAIPNGKLPVCQVSMTVGMTTIANSIITDERTTYGPLAKLLRMPVEQVNATTSGFTREVLLVDRGILFDCDCSNGPVELMLPDSAQAGNGFMIGLIKTDATTNSVTLTPSTTGETFNDGALTKQVSAQNGAAILTTDGLGQWYLAFDSSRTYDNVTLTGTTTAETVNVNTLNVAVLATAPTPSENDNSTKIATTEFVQDKLTMNLTSPREVGTAFSVATMGVAAIAALNERDIAFVDDVNDELRTYRFNGTWSQVGSGLSISTITIPAIAALNSTDVAFIDTTNDELRTYRFNGSTWSQVGSGLAISTVTFPAVAALNSTDVAFIDETNDELRTYRFNGSTWSQVGNSLSISGISFYPGLAALSTTDIALIDGGLDVLRTYRFDGTNWTLIGNSLSIPGVGDTGITALNSTDVVVIDSLLDTLRAYRFDGTNWSQMGFALSVAVGTGITRLAALNKTDVAWADTTSDQLHVYRFDYYLGSTGPYHP